MAGLGRWPFPAWKLRRLHLAIENDHHLLTLYWSLDGKTWTRHGVGFETSGAHANTMNDLASLRSALFAAGKGKVRFRDYRFAARS